MILRHFVFVLVILFGCKATQTIQADQSQPEANFVDNIEEKNDTTVIEYFHPIKDYRSTSARSFDLLHTSLQLKFDWEQQWVIGEATLKLVPYYYPQDLLVLDAKSMALKGVFLLENGEKETLKYQYINDKIFIELGRAFTKNEELTISIEYDAKPNEIEVDGSEAITSDKGLYFINPEGKDPYKPQQIWTQGETTANSAWFPTIDSPNERCTQEMYVTVADTLETISNGVKVSSVNNNDGTRTDYWRMEKPHAPYLFMLAVGDFAKVTDNWQGIPLGYYVEPEYESVAKNILY